MSAGAPAALRRAPRRRRTPAATADWCCRFCCAGPRWAAAPSIHEEHRAQSSCCQTSRCVRSAARAAQVVRCWSLPGRLGRSVAPCGGHARRRGRRGRGPTGRVSPAPAAETMARARRASRVLTVRTSGAQPALSTCASCRLLRQRREAGDKQGRETRSHRRDGWRSSLGGDSGRLVASWSHCAGVHGSAKLMGNGSEARKNGPPP